LNHQDAKNQEPFFLPFCFSCRPGLLGGFPFFPNFNALGVRPELFEVVEITRLLAHDMHDHVTEVDQHPVTELLAFNANAPHTVTTQGFRDLVGAGLHMPIRGAGGDYHVVREIADLADIEYRDILRLGVLQGILDPLLGLLGFGNFGHQFPRLA